MVSDLRGVKGGRMEDNQDYMDSEFLPGLEEKISQTIDFLKQHDMPYEDLLHLTASLMVTTSELIKRSTETTEIGEEYANLFQTFFTSMEEESHKINLAFQGVATEGRNIAARNFLAGMEHSKQMQAKKGAQKRHVETYTLRAEIVAYWKSNIDPTLSADKAATLLTKQFPVSHRKISEYIAAEKKIRRAGKA
jgi:hypothetical protein